MADVTDVCATIGSYLSTLIYPNGPTQPTTSGLPATVTLMTGWPTMSDIDTMMQKNISLINVYPKNFEVTHIHLPFAPQLISTIPTTISIVQQANTFTFTGTPTPGQYIMVSADNVWNAYLFTSSDTLSTIIANIAAVLIKNGFNATYTATTLTVLDVYQLQAVIGTQANTLFETKMQTREFLIIITASNPQDRDNLTRFVDAQLSNIYRLENSDGSWCTISYKASPIEDDFQKQRFYQRQLWYDVSFSTTLPAVESMIDIWKLNFTPTS